MHRRTRLLQSTYELPSIFLVGAADRRSADGPFRVDVRLGKTPGAHVEVFLLTNFW